tara:strand:+ start:837 stop:1295 length:459 start_codon:yes stop_codon:yes gene_type:complete
MEPQGMTPEEKAAVMQFMGTTYGQAHQQDKMLVGGSSNLQPKSQELKKVFEQTAHMPTVSRQPQQPTQQAAAPPAEVNTVTPEQAAQEISAQQTIRTQQPPTVEQIDPNQVEFDFSEPSKLDQLIDLIKDQNLILKDISLKLDNGKDSKVKK